MTTDRHISCGCQGPWDVAAPRHRLYRSDRGRCDDARAARIVVPMDVGDVWRTDEAVEDMTPRA